MGLSMKRDVYATLAHGWSMAYGMVSKSIAMEYEDMSSMHSVPRNDIAYLTGVDGPLSQTTQPRLQSMGEPCMQCMMYRSQLSETSDYDKLFGSRLYFLD